MKKMISVFMFLIIVIILIFSGSAYAVSLDTIDIEVDKATVRPDEEVTVTINFGQDLGAYTFDVSYDDNIFEYISVDGGTANDTGDKVKVTYHDATGGTNPRTNMSVKFKAKADITTSNPTEFTVVGEGLANADASVTFDDITTPIVKNVTVEPQYIDYTLKLEHTGDIIKAQEKEMTLSYSSPMGRYYEHARLIAESTSPAGATVQLLATDSSHLEHDIIQSGWGDAQGDKIGGKDVEQVLHVRGIFSEVGDYTITLKLIDRDNSDQVITEKTFSFKVIEETTITPPVENQQEEEPIVTPEVTPSQQEEETLSNKDMENVPSELPKTGRNIFAAGTILLIALVASFGYYNRKR